MTSYGRDLDKDITTYGWRGKMVGKGRTGMRQDGDGANRDGANRDSANRDGAS